MDNIQKAKHIQTQLYTLAKKKSSWGSFSNRVDQFFSENYPDLPWEILRPLQRMLFMDTKANKKGPSQGNRKINTPENTQAVPRVISKIAMCGLINVFNSIPFDLEYLDYMEKRRLVFAEKLVSNDLVREAYFFWNYFDEEERLKTLWRIGFLQDEAFGNKSLQFLNLRNIKIQKGKSNDQGCYENGTVIIYPESKPRKKDGFSRYWWENFTEVLRVFVHEKTHHHQEQIAIAFSKNAIPPNSVFFQQGEYIQDYYVPAKGAIYVPHEINKKAYNAILIERESYEAEKVAQIYENNMGGNKTRSGILRRVFNSVLQI